MFSIRECGILLLLLSRVLVRDIVGEMISSNISVYHLQLCVYLDEIISIQAYADDLVSLAAVS